MVFTDLRHYLQIRKGLEAAVSTRIAGEEAVHLARMYLGMGKYGVPKNPVAWDGYAHEREQVMARLNFPGETQPPRSITIRDIW